MLVGLMIYKKKSNLHEMHVKAEMRKYLSLAPSQLDFGKWCFSECTFKVGENCEYKVVNEFREWIQNSDTTTKSPTPDIYSG